MHFKYFFHNNKFIFQKLTTILFIICHSDVVFNLLHIIYTNNLRKYYILEDNLKYKNKE